VQQVLGFTFDFFWVSIKAHERRSHPVNRGGKSTLAELEIRDLETTSEMAVKPLGFFLASSG
jgi:hypothetical protein